MMSVNQLKVLLVSYTYKVDDQPTYIAGPPQDCAQYLRTRVAKLAFIEQPSPISEDLALTATVWEHGQRVQAIRCAWGRPRVCDGRNLEQHTPWHYVWFKCRELLVTLYLVWKVRDRYDLFIGVEAINAMVGVWLRRLRRVKRVVYDVIDYSPQRFASPRLNRFFHAFDGWCVAHVDFCWNQTALVGQARAQRGMRVASVQLVKPSGAHAGRIHHLPEDRIGRTTLVYVGSLQARDGVWVMLDALPAIVREVPAVTLRIIGAGNEEAAMRSWLEARRLDDRVQFLGMVGDRTAVEQVVATSAVALAPYQDTGDTVKRYNDPSKPRLYLACGVPVVITRVPPVADEIDREGAGLAVSSHDGAFARAVVRLLTDEALYRACRQGAVRLAERYTWDRIFDQLFRTMDLEAATA